MRIAETVTFGGSGLDRHAGLRRDVAGLSQALARGTVLPLWRGKPLLDGNHLAWVPAGHPVLAQAGPPVFLGIDDGTPRFAADLSDWSPEAGAAAPEAGFFDGTVQQRLAVVLDRVVFLVGEVEHLRGRTRRKVEAVHAPIEGGDEH